MKLNIVCSAYDKMKKNFPSFHFPSVKPPSKMWLSSFKERTDMKSAHASPMEKIRSETATVGNISWWYDNVISKIDWENYDPKFIFNADETMLKQSNKMVVIVPSKTKRPLVKQDESTEHVTIMTCVSASGELMPPLFIFPLKTLPLELDDFVAQGRMTIAGQPEGWINREIFIEWTKQFVLFVKERRSKFKTPNANAILFVDAHNSREAPEALKLMKDNQITCVTYPPDSTHILQAVDVGIFSPFKSYLQKQRRYNDALELHWDNPEYEATAQSVRRDKLAISALDALRQATTTTNIKSAFEKAGIWPIKKERALENPRIGPSKEVTLTMTTPKKRKKISIASRILTSSEVIDEIEKANNDAVPQRYDPLASI